MAYEAIVNGDGIYATKGGRLVFISEREEEPETGRLLYRGYMNVLQDKVVVCQWHTWTSDGRCCTMGPENDIVGKV